MAMTTEHDLRLDRAKPFADCVRVASREAAVLDFVDEIKIIPRRCRMAREDARRDKACHRQLAQKEALLLGKLTKGETVRRPHFRGRELCDLPVVLPRTVSASSP